MSMEMEQVLKLWRVEESDSEFSIFDFDQIADATDNFSDDHKLGQGGFGPVYKVLRSTDPTGGALSEMPCFSSHLAELSDQSINQFFLRNNPSINQLAY